MLNNIVLLPPPKSLTLHYGIIYHTIKALYLLHKNLIYIRRMLEQTN